MKIDEFIEIMDDSKYSTEYIGDDTVFEGLKILKKYGPFRIEGAEHDIIYCVSVEKIVDAGITKKDAILLSRMGWHVDSEIDYPGFLAHFV